MPCQDWEEFWDWLEGHNARTGLELDLTEGLLFVHRVGMREVLRKGKGKKKKKKKGKRE